MKMFDETINSMQLKIFSRVFRRDCYISNRNVKIFCIRGKFRNENTKTWRTGLELILIIVEILYTERKYKS